MILKSRFQKKRMDILMKKQNYIMRKKDKKENGLEEAGRSSEGGCQRRRAVISDALKAAMEDAKKLKK